MAMVIKNVISITKHVILANENLRKVDTIISSDVVRRQIIRIDVGGGEFRLFQSSSCQPLRRRWKKGRRFEESNVFARDCFRGEVAYYVNLKFGCFIDGAVSSRVGVACIVSEWCDDDVVVCVEVCCFHSV